MKQYLNISTGKLISEEEEEDEEEEEEEKLDKEDYGHAVTRINGSHYESRNNINNDSEEEVAEDAYERVVREQNEMMLL